MAKTFDEKVEQLRGIAAQVLPHASESKDPMQQIYGIMGIIPDTYEWVNVKLKGLTADDEASLREWRQYIISKAEERLYLSDN